ncbi:epidermal growth factor-like protein 7 isoform X6 [Marmota marmota marmota]|uniref:epidermal growth factor-like protein 7 isoform X6 n=1 Tax=Marmota marmota marmota TaxID=9994 RepID=UPI002093E93A|nr:epidermal growth factor-like protein 7 isoform X6 [Marmota marmota marmota]
MWGSQELLLVWFLVLAVGGTEHVYRPSRRVCAVGVARGPISESFVQRVYQPLLTTCDGHRACSTYRTIYRTAYRRSPGPAPARPQFACCPGWKRTSGLPGACGAGEGSRSQDTAVPRYCHPGALEGTWHQDSRSQQYASHRVGTEGAVSIQATATALQGGRVTPARQMWTSAALEEPAVPSAVSTLQAATGASAGRGTARLQTAHSACPREGPPGWPQVPQQEWTAW